MAASVTSNRNIVSSFDVSGSDNEIVSLARMPRNGKTLDHIENPEQDDADEREQDERREHCRQLEIADGALQHKTEAGIGADKFADHGADNSERERHFQTGEDRRQSMRQPDHAEDLQA